MSRLYHSPSSDAAGQRCERYWWYVYGENRRDPDVPWETIAHYVCDAKRDASNTLWWRDPSDPAKRVKSGQRSTSLGKAVHGVLEGWYTGASGIDWHGGLPGQVALSGLHHLPRPDRCHKFFVESAIGDEPIVGAKEHAPPTGLRIDGVLWAGFRDLVVEAPGELLRLGIDAPDGWALLDYKSTADIARYAHTPASLHNDIQDNVYTYATCDELGLTELPSRWIYFETKKVRRALPIDIKILKVDAERVVSAACGRSKYLDTLTRAEDARQNPQSCGDYGGCPFHSTVGGPCVVRRSLGTLIQARTKKRNDTMGGLNANLKNRFNAKFKGGAAADTAADAPVSADTEAAEPAKTPRKPRTPKAAAQAEPEAEAASTADGLPDESFVLPPMSDTGRPVTIVGHPSDVLRIASQLLHA